MATLALLLLLAPGAAEWADDLSAPDPARRAAAVQRLVALGDEAAAELEGRDFPDPEARRLARGILQWLRRPRLELHVPPHVGRTEAHVDLLLVVENPSREPIELAGFWMRRKGKIRRDPHWSLRCGPGLGEPETRVAGNLSVAPRDRQGFLLRVPLQAPADGAIPIEITCRHEGLLLRAEALLTVGGDAAAVLRRAAASRDPERRDLALRLLRYHLEHGSAAPGFERALAAAVRSPYAEVRRGAAHALARHGRGAQRDHLLRLAADRDADVAREALLGLPRHWDLAGAPAPLRRVVTRALVSAQEERREAVRDMLASVPPRQRRVFLAHVLAKSRTPAVHAAAAALLRADGLAVEIDPRTGFVPGSAIRRLATG